MSRSASAKILAVAECPSSLITRHSLLSTCYDRPMPLIRCPKCGQAYDIPGVIAVRLPNSIATCHCGEWLAGSKAAVLARMLNPQEIKEVDLQPYRVEMPAAPPREHAAVVGATDAPFEPRSVRVIT